MSDIVWKPDEMAALNAVLAEKDATIDGLRAQLATAQKWRTRWKAMAHRKRQHHRNALAALGLNITYVRELQQEVKRLDEQVDGLQAQLATAQQELADVSATDATAVFSADIGTAKIPNEGLVDYVRWNVVVEKWDEQLGRIADIAERINTRAARDIEERERRMQQYEQYD